MKQNHSIHHCHMCGATNYRRVIARDESGALRQTALYQCSGCNVVFADAKTWREGVTPATSTDLPAPRPGLHLQGPASAASHD